MATPTVTTTIKRITVAIDCSPYSRASLSAAAEIAGRLHAELSGVFIEDINLLRMAELPFTQEIQVHTARFEPFDLARAERMLKKQSRAASRLLRESAERFAIPHSFRTLRGTVPSLLLSAALDTDLLAIGRWGNTPSCKRGLGSTAQKAVRESKTNVLVAHHAGFSLQSPLVVLFDGSRGALNALETALGLVQQKTHLHVFLLANNEAEQEKNRNRAEQHIGRKTGLVEFHNVPLTSGTLLRQCINMTGPGLLLVSENTDALDKEAIYRLIDSVECPVLLVRSTA